VGITELGNILGINKSVVSRLVKKGMPTNSVDAAQAWRAINAPPRAKRGQAGTRPPAPKIPDRVILSQPLPPAPKPLRATKDDPQPNVPEPESASSADAMDEDEIKNDPRQSLRRARKAEMAGYNQLVKCQRDGGSVEDFRKANSIYIHSRNNRVKAERDFQDWQRDQGILLYFDEARDIASRPHVAARGMIEVMPKNLAPRLHGQPLKAIEAALVQWCDRLTETIRSKI
jgi:hypothetical protein